MMPKRMTTILELRTTIITIAPVSVDIPETD